MPTKQILCRRGLAGSGAFPFTRIGAIDWGNIEAAYGQSVWLGAGTFRNLKVKRSSTISGTTTFTLRINGVDTSLTVTIAAGQTEASDTLQSAVVAVGDIVGFHRAETGSQSNDTLWLSVEYYSTESAVSCYTTFSNTFSTASLRHSVFIDGGVAPGSPTVFFNLVSAPGNITRYDVLLDDVPGGTLSIQTGIYVNGVLDPGSTLTISGGSETLFSWTGSVRCERGDRVVFSSVPTGSGNGPAADIGFRYVSDTDGESNICNWSTDGLNDGETLFGSPTATIVELYSSNEATKVLHGGISTFALRNMVGYGNQQFSGPVTSDGILRINGADATPAVHLVDANDDDDTASVMITENDEWAWKFAQIDHAALFFATLQTSWTMFALTTGSGGGGDLSDPSTPCCTPKSGGATGGGGGNGYGEGGGNGVPTDPGVTGPVNPTVTTDYAFVCAGLGLVPVEDFVWDSEAYQ